MKKKIYSGVAVLAVAAVAAWNVNLGSKSNGLSSTSVANVEALATESSGRATPCGDPKTNGDCESRNDVNCKDLSGCQ